MPNWDWSRARKLVLNKEELAAYNYAARLLARREYCTSELRGKLSQREYEHDVVTTVLQQLKQNGYLSEIRFAEAYLRSRLSRGETPWLAAQKAKQKGVDHAVLDAAVAEVCEGYDDEQVCMKLLEQRDSGGLRFEDERVWQRQARFLRNKGHNSATILRVLNQGKPEGVFDD